MALQGKEADKLYLPLVGISLLLLGACLYWHCYGLWQVIGWTHPFIDRFLLSLGGGRLMGEYTVKLMILVFVFCFSIVRIGMTTDASWAQIILMLAGGAALFFFPWVNPGLFLITTVSGYVLLIWGFILLGRKTSGATAANNDKRETFEQCGKKIETDYTVNIAMRYFYKGRFHDGWINVFPYMGSAVMGLPGTGKSFAVYYNFIDQMCAKGFTFFLYDYKAPELTRLLYNKWLKYYPGKWVDAERRHRDGTVYTVKEYVAPEGAPKFCVLNMDDPLMSMRCNPLSTRYLVERADCQEVATVIFDSLQGKNKGGGGNSEFFRQSGIAYIAAQLEYLRTYKGGVYCSFPHLIELMAHNYEEVFDLLMDNEDLKTMITPFKRALDNKVMEQLQGQIDSAMIPMIQFSISSLYWVLTTDPAVGDDFTLDINNPDEPKYVCVGNNPDRQTIYGTTLSLYTTRLFKVVNHPFSRSGKRNLKSAIILDELPTIFLDKLDNLIATARSNCVAVVLGIQDKTQLIRDYNRENAEVIMNTVGNILSGRVNFETAHILSGMFGKEFRMQQSHTTGSNSDSVSTSWQLQEILPESQISNLSQGYFCGKTADEAAHMNDHKLFCAQIKNDAKARKLEEAAFLPVPSYGKKYFNDDEIEYEIRKNPLDECMAFMREKIAKEEQLAAWKDPHYTSYSPISIERLVADRWKKMSKKEREAVLEETIRARQAQARDRLVGDNTKRIRLEIDSIFEDYRDRHTNDDPAAGGPAVAPATDGGAATKATAPEPSMSVPGDDDFDDILGGMS